MRTGALRLLVVVAALAAFAFPPSASAADTTPPTATITSPSAGTVLRGNVVVTVNASDDVGVDQVVYRFFDGSQVTTLGTASQAPFTFTFDSTALPDCAPSACTLYAQAVDAAGNTSGGQFGDGIAVGVNNEIVVDTTADNTPTGCSLRAAIESANTNTAVAGCTAGLSDRPDTIQVPAGTYDLSAQFGQLVVSSDLNIFGFGARSTDIRGYSLGQRVLEIASGNVLIGGVKIEGGNTLLNGPEPNAGVGGGIWVSTGSLTLENSIVSANHADQSGGGIDSSGSLTVLRSTIENNSAGCGVISCGLGIGGGIDDFGSGLSITNTTITGNQAQGDGGGLFVASASTLTNDTIANNQADLSGAPGAGGGAIATYSGIDPHTVSLTNTLLAGNTWNGDGGNECSTGGVASNGGNLADDSSCGLTATADQQGVDPLLGQLDSSSSTDVLPLTAGSPAIDAALDLACPAVDQRGVPRPQGPHCDVGAFELAQSSGSLSGSVDSTIVRPVDLTATGAADWAVWGYNSDTGNQPASALTPNETKANGGRQISDLSIVNGDGTPTRGFAGFGLDLLPYSFNWTDGAPDASVTGGLAGLTAPKAGQGLSFTVPASKILRTLTVWTSAHFTTGTFTAQLSDGSAPNYTQTIQVGQGSSPGTGDNAPETFTLRYRAASAGQHLTVTWTEDADQCGGCDDVVLYAAALTGGGNATSASAALGTGRSVEMSGSNDAVADIPLSAFEVTPSGVTPAPINGLPINGLPINGLPINGLPINGLPINGLPINGLPINGLPINGLPINGLPINGLPINGLPINGLPLNGLQLPGVDWESVLAGTPLADKPLQTITLQQVLALSPQPSAVQNLTLGDLVLANSQLGQMTIGALALGSTPINGLGSESSTIEQQLQDWCEAVVTSGDPGTDCSLANIGNQSLFALGLAGAPINGLPINGLPINGLPINGLPINGLPINGLDLSASPINGLPINGLPINGLPINGLPAVTLSDVVDCTKIDCATATLGDAAAAGAIVPGATYGDLLRVLLADGSPVQSTLTLGDVIGLLIKRADVPWETLPPRVLSVFDPNRPTLNTSASFRLQGSGTPSADVQLRIPDGFDYDPGSATLTEGDGEPQQLADPTVDGRTLDWQIDSVDPDVTYAIGFKLRSGTTVGPAQITETVTSGSQSDTSVAAFPVTDSYPSSGDPSEAPRIDPNDGVQMSALATPGAVDYYTIPMPPAGTRLQVHLTNLPADYDLALYSPRTTSVRTSATPAPPLQDGIVSDPQIDLAGGSNGQLAPTALRDLPDPGIPVVQVSANRGTDDEDVGMVSPGGGGSVTIAVFGYNGAFSPQPYSLRVKATAPPAPQSCDARSFPHLGQGTTPDSLPDLSNLPGNLNTIILVDEKRLGDTYGSDSAHTTDGQPGEAETLAALHRLAGDASLGVSGVVVPVERIPGVQALYDTWDSNPCDPDAANAIANAIADEVDAIKAAAGSSVQYVVFGGGDDQIPFFRLPDLSLIANESGFAGQFGSNEYAGSLAAGDLLSDNPYLDTRPIPASGRQLFIPDLVGGRLVETTADITNAVTSFEGSGGVLRSSTGFVSGYDFVADGSHQVASRLSSLGVNVQTLIDDSNPFVPSLSWTKAGLLSAAFPTGGQAAINDWNGHYDNTRAEMANGDILSTGELTGTDAINGGIFFTMGCHAGFQTTDVVVGSSVLDWPQYFAEHNTGFVGNTGFGLGNTDSVAFSEELMGYFAGELGGSVTLGQALAQAKEQYYLSRVAFSNYDEKTLSEAELYGLPMYGVGHAPASLLAAAPLPDPVSGTTSSTSPSQGTLDSFPGNSVQAASFAASPHFVGPVQGHDGDYYTNDGQVQAPNYRPLQPYVSLPAARSGLTAHGVVVDSLTSSDHTGFDPDNVRPTLDLSANEPEPQFTDEAWPEKIPTLVSLGSDQSLNLITGQFFTESSGGTSTGVERLWTQIGGRVTYSTSNDYTAPTIDSIDAFLGNGAVAFTGRFSDLDQNGNPGSVAFAQVVFDDGTGHWNALPLQYDPSSGMWSGGASFSGQNVQYFVEACDTAGNCGYSSNKGRYFDAQPLPTGSGGGSLTISPDRQADTGTWYTGSLDVSATSSAPAVSVSADGGPFTSAFPVTLAGDGVHVVEARDSDGNTATGVYLIDTTAPQITHGISPAAPNGTNGWYTTKPTVKFACNDNVSGVASCLADGGNSDSIQLGDGSSQGASATSTDNAGHTSHDSVSGIKVDSTAPATPAFTGISAQIYPVNSLPAQSSIGCTSSDAVSGVLSCVVTGYGNAIGAHTLTATATDNAGNTTTATLTYTVGFQVGDILAPVTSASGDQTNPNATDLQVFKIKSTVPLKFQLYLDAAKTTLMTTPPTGSTAFLTVAKYSSSTTSTDQTDLITGSADTDNQFRWTGATAYQYVYNMGTSKLSTGRYYCQLTLKASDGTVLAQSAPQYFVLRS
ncbi:MAG TPA: choice-of-anchor Q domain-containing protein [Gaiellaceae bacterium]|nr:choice-of-anchor Q domain-containing protein [Gaiellaceae bacterium]